MTKNRKIAYLAASATAIIWGAAFPVVKPALSLITPFQFLYLRFLLAGILMLPLIIHHLVKRKFPFHKLGKIVLLETVSMIVLGIIYIGLEQTQALQASFIMNTKPIFMTIAGVILLREVEERHELIGLVLSAIGTGLVIASPLIFGQDITSTTDISFFGNFLIIFAVFIEVFRLINVKKHYHNIDKFLVVSVSSVIGAIFFYLLNLFSGTLPSLEVLTYPPVILAVGYMGSVGSVLAFSFSLIAYSRIEASEASLFEYLNPLVYIPLSVFWLKETLFPTQLIGILIIGIGVYIAERRTRQKRSKKYLSIPHPLPSLQHAKLS